MNWLIYIGGGYLYFLIVGNIIIKMFELNKEEKWLSSLSTCVALFLIWIWICWRFIQ